MSVFIDSDKGSFVSILMPRGKTKKLVSFPACKGPAKKTTARVTATIQSSFILENTSTHPKRTVTTTTQLPATKKCRISMSGTRTGDSQEGSTAYTKRQQARRPCRVRATSVAQ